MTIALWAAAVLVAFAIGSIPFGYIIGKTAFGTDIRREGSGNIGAMNALRTLGKRGAASVLILDALKGFVPAFIAVRAGMPDLAACVAAAAVLGHCYSPWLGWRGGKGVATSFGAVFAFSWLAGVLTAAAWIAGAGTTRYSSVGSMLGSVLAPVFVWFTTRSIAETVSSALVALLVLFAHRENIARLRAGTERAIGAGRT
ncbi:MAG TPA: glycerol-3-phosphate 1-O-acyltransferase PlsY [Candidatus Tumulicola sp.]